MGKPLERSAPPSLYEEDFYAWTQDQAQKLRARGHNEIDRENLAEEIDSVGRSQKREIRSRLVVLLQHLLKWEYQPERRSHSWQSSISEQRIFIRGIIDDSPSLRQFPVEAAAWAYPYARDEAADETGLPVSTFPVECPWPVEDVLAFAFMPGPPWSTDDLTRD